MTSEVSAAAKGAQEAGAEVIRVKDAHDWARNIIPSELPAYVSMHRGWSGSPLCMVDGLDEGFDALAFTGYHSPSHGSGSPLSHTMMSKIQEFTINGSRASEFVIHSYIAAMLSIPVIFLSGDFALCEQAKALVPGIVTVATQVGRGNAVTALHPLEAETLIHDGMKAAVENKGEGCYIKLPDRFEVTVEYDTHPKAYRNSFYPGASLLDEKTIGFCADDYMDVLRFFLFVV
jgi:D-amino peptidase